MGPCVPNADAAAARRGPARLRRSAVSGEAVCQPLLGLGPAVRDAARRRRLGSAAAADRANAARRESIPGEGAIADSPSETRTLYKISEISLAENRNLCYRETSILKNNLTAFEVGAGREDRAAPRQKTQGGQNPPYNPLKTLKIRSREPVRSPPSAPGAPAAATRPAGSSRAAGEGTLRRPASRRWRTWR